MYRDKLRSYGCGEVPSFDPMNGGISSQLLFLFEKPGPMTSSEGTQLGSGFISPDNDDPTAEATFNFIASSGIPREMAVFWNIIPWWNGTRDVKPEELDKGLSELCNLVAILEKLRVVVLVGRKAQRAEDFLLEKEIPFLKSPHPSPLVRARYPDQWLSIPSIWGQALKFIA